MIIESPALSVNIPDDAVEIHLNRNRSINHEQNHREKGCNIGRALMAVTKNKSTELPEEELKRYANELRLYYHHNGPWPNLTADQLQQVRRYQGRQFRKKLESLNSIDYVGLSKVL